MPCMWLWVPVPALCDHIMIHPFPYISSLDMFAFTRTKTAQACAAGRAVAMGAGRARPQPARNGTECPSTAKDMTGASRAAASAAMATGHPAHAASARVRARPFASSKGSEERRSWAAVLLLALVSR